ncbi:unnamed protein product, partial [Prorocentrum cordatum]
QPRTSATSWTWTGTGRSATTSGSRRSSSWTRTDTNGFISREEFTGTGGHGALFDAIDTRRKGGRRISLT